MAYNNGFPIGYQQMYYPQQYQQTSQANQPSIIWVSSENEALSYPVAPNNAVTLWSTTEPVVYLKQADAMGKPTLKTYDLVERVSEPFKGASVKGKESIEYAPKSDLAAVAGAVKDVNEVLDDLKAEIETMKGDLYGVAGRKRVRKVKEEDEE